MLVSEVQVKRMNTIIYHANLTMLIYVAYYLIISYIVFYTKIEKLSIKMNVYI